MVVGGVWRDDAAFAVGVPEKGARVGVVERVFEVPVEEARFR